MDSIQSLLSAVALFALFAFLALLCLAGIRFVARLVRRMFGIETAPERASRLMHARLANPDWALFSQHLGRPAAKPLVDLYAGLGTAYRPTAKFQDVDVYLSPIDAGAIASDPEDLEGHEIVPIAHDANGRPVYLKRAPESNEAVYVHDGRREWILASTIVEFASAFSCARSATSQLAG
jgi:hypothetical protein